MVDGSALALYSLLAPCGGWCVVVGGGWWLVAGGLGCGAACAWLLVRCSCVVALHGAWCVVLRYGALWALWCVIVARRAL